MMRIVAFYLPQFHPIPENDRWWGTGFTEWRNVVRARPQFRGHYQPHVPADLGFYDLRLAEARHAQAALAREFGIEGFCYYHYWFNGRRLLEQPFEAVLSSGEPNHSFCLCWANEPWTRRWNGHDGEVLMQHTSNDADDRAHMECLVRAFRDPRYLRIGRRPVFLVYRTDLLPDPAGTARTWRAVAEEHAMDLYLLRVETLSAPIDPAAIGFDGAVEFAPDWLNAGVPQPPSVWQRAMRVAGVTGPGRLVHSIHNYETLRSNMLAKRAPAYKFFRGVTPGFDNTSRRATGATIFEGATPGLYESWLEQLVDWTERHHRGDERLIFVNAWNEWAEGNHLEPDLTWGRAYLEATQRAMGRERRSSETLAENPA